MKKILLSLAIALGALSAYADTPFVPEVAEKFNAIEKQTGTSNQWTREVRAVYDVSVGTNGATGAHGLGVFLPAKATILDGFVYFPNRMVGPGTLALHCEDANNILTAQTANVHVAGSIIKINADLNPFNVVKGTTIAARCEVTATVATTAYTAGKAVALIHYFVAE